MKSLGTEITHTLRQTKWKEQRKWIVVVCQAEK